MRHVNMVVTGNYRANKTASTLILLRSHRKDNREALGTIMFCYRHGVGQKLCQGKYPYTNSWDEKSKENQFMQTHAI